MAWEIPWRSSLIAALLWAVAGSPMATVMVPVTMKAVAPVVCASGTARVAVTHEEVVSTDGTSTSFSLWCIDREGVRERAGDVPVFGALAGAWFVGVFVLLTVARARRRLLVVTAAALLASLPGCTAGTLDRDALNATTRGYCHASRGAARALADLRARVGGPLRARSLTLYTDVVIGEFIDPRDASHVDTWRWYVSPATGRPDIEAPSPVRADGRTVDVIEVERVRWDRVDAMVSATLARAASDGASISTLSVEASAEGPRVRVSWVSPRSSGASTFDREGTRIETR